MIQVGGISVPEEDSADLLKEARAALARMEARKGEDVHVWADRLASDLAKFTD